MVTFPNCKINLGLHITAKRNDGFHDLETVFYPIALTDVLEILQQQETVPTNEVDFTTSGHPIDGDPADNLCIKAYHLLKKDFPNIPPVRLHLHKAIPMGAGLGGGSSDAAFVLKMLNEKFQLGISTQQLSGYALELGSDCPFFIQNQPCFASGRGERLLPLQLTLEAYNIVIVYPGIHINTGWAFSQVRPAPPAKAINEIIRQPIETWKDELKNDFETPVFQAHPPVRTIKENFYAQGAVYASLSGSGSTVFGIFDKKTPVEAIRSWNGTVFIV